MGPSAVSLPALIRGCSSILYRYDDPRLWFMYVDKPLRGSRAVQTLGRLARVGARKAQSTDAADSGARAPGNDDGNPEDGVAVPLSKAVKVVDFVNLAGSIQESFEEYAGMTQFRTGEAYCLDASHLPADDAAGVALGDELGGIKVDCLSCVYCRMTRRTGKNPEAGEGNGPLCLAPAARSSAAAGRALPRRAPGRHATPGMSSLRGCCSVPCMSCTGPPTLRKKERKKEGKRLPYTKGGS